MRLSFTGALDGASAGDAVSYSVEINGATVAIEDVSVGNAGQVVALMLPEGSIHSGDLVRVTWNLRDSTGKALTGAVGPLAAR